MKFFGIAEIFCLPHLKFLYICLKYCGDFNHITQIVHSNAYLSTLEVCRNWELGRNMTGEAFQLFSCLVNCFVMTNKATFLSWLIFTLGTLKSLYHMYRFLMSNKVTSPTCLIFTLWTFDFLPVYWLMMHDKVTFVIGLMLTLWTFFLWIRSWCKISEPYDNSILQKVKNMQDFFF